MLFRSLTAVYHVSTSPITAILGSLLRKSSLDSLMYIMITTIAIYLVLILLHAYFQDWLPQSLSLLLTTILVLSPTQAPLHTYLFPVNSSKTMYTPLLANFPVPAISIIGFCALLNYSKQLFRNRSFKTRNTILITLVMLLIHPILFVLSFLIFTTHLGIRKKKEFWSLNWRQNAIIFVFFGIGGFLLILVSVTSSHSYLGAVTSEYSLQLIPFNLALYLILPAVITSGIRSFFRISYSEFIFHYYPIIICFIAEFFLTVISLVYKRNLLAALEFHGLLYLFHILYYLPILYILTTRANLNQNSIFSNRAVNSKVNIFNFLSVVLIVYIVVRIFVPQYGEGDIRRCAIPSSRIARELQAPESELLRNPVQGIVKFGAKNLDERQFDEFMVNPYSAESRSYFCGYKGLGFMLLNGFSFDNSAELRAQNILGDYERSKK